MSRKRLQHLSVCFSAALLVTVGAYALDSQRAGVQQTMAGLQWARQVATQAEGMVLKAREQGERDPIAWAVNYLAQGVEPRVVLVSRVRAQAAEGESLETESYSLDRAIGHFDYTRIFNQEDGAGIRIQLSLGYVGFLGARSELASDFLTVSLLSLLFAIAFFRTGRYFGFDDTRHVRALVGQWVSGAKAQLTRHGSHVREMVRQSQRLAVSSGRSRTLVGDLREKIHAGLTELHDSRDFYKEGERIATRAETLALNMAIEANRLGGDARRIAVMATELHRSLQALHAVNRKGQALVQSLEIKVEPWATDADLAFHAFDDVKHATELLGQHIRSTTESLLDQARLIQGRNRELGPAGNDVPVVPSTSQVAVAAQAELSVVESGSRSANDSIPALPAPLPPIQDVRRKTILTQIRQIRHVQKLKKAQKQRRKRESA